GVQIAIYPGPALPALEFAQVSEEGIQAILAEAKGAGLLAGDQNWNEATTIVTDAHTGELTITTGGQTSVIRVYAPGMTGFEDQLSDEEIAFRHKFDDFTGKLQSLSSWLPEGAVTPHEEEYPLNRIQIITQPGELAPVGDPNIDPDHIEWP